MSVLSLQFSGVYRADSTQPQASLIRGGFSLAGQLTGGPSPKRGSGRENVFVGVKPGGEIVIATSSNQRNTRGKIHKGLVHRLTSALKEMNPGFFKTLAEDRIGVFEATRSPKEPVKLDIFNRDGSFINSSVFPSHMFQTIQANPTWNKFLEAVDKSPKLVLNLVQAMRGNPSIFNENHQEEQQNLRDRKAWADELDRRHPVSLPASNKKLG